MSVVNRSEVGSTMIEVLVSVVVVAIGLLGMASLQLNSVKTSFDSAGQSQASWLAQGIDVLDEDEDSSVTDARNSIGSGLRGAPAQHHNRKRIGGRIRYESM